MIKGDPGFESPIPWPKSVWRGGKDNKSLRDKSDYEPKGEY